MLSLLDFAIHFAMDRIKALQPRMLGRCAEESRSHEAWPTATDEQKRGNKLFWLSLGFDQYVHHLTNLLIAWILISG